ncbi:ABC transporter permease [Psychromarinibacter halotolerans]|uniref:ABC transporter permease n=1 Tax=Psychromarinibacter halotolerans TaxID=1775175 RepID=A0ABV7GMY9_9RHOB|nr:ABC transporter permease [Psychromarinibacter halotolerans]MDF0597391.1 ABC transporter permease [Psychromarinibacter halotolerans]
MTRIKGFFVLLTASPIAFIGFVMTALLVLVAAFAGVIAPYPEHVGPIGDFTAIMQGPSAAHWFGTDTVGRDIFSRVLFGLRTSLLMVLVVLSVAPIFGVSIGLIAGYFGGWVETVLMRLTDVFLSIPPLVLAMSVLGFLSPNLTNGIIAVTVMWWPWYTRLAYNLMRRERSQGYVAAAEMIGASWVHIVFREVLPNCLSPILSKILLDTGFIIIIAASLSFVGLGSQPPAPDLGSMIAAGTDYLPANWWLTAFPSLALLYAAFSVNMLGDGIRELLEKNK